ncbi:hypothetical protein [Scytonema sp. NUACC26]|uniref:hypothetical protein n=1 Tax=Scytonema sp. NUACC26 TaxID=3140176 RepID=UPI0034DBDC5A
MTTIAPYSTNRANKPVVVLYENLVNELVRYLFMARRGGNPDFGTKYRFDNGRSEPLSEQVKAQVHPDIKRQLKDLADQENCTIPDLIREAIEQYLASKQTTQAS